MTGPDRSAGRTRVRRSEGWPGTDVLPPHGTARERHSRSHLRRREGLDLQLHRQLQVSSLPLVLRGGKLTAVGRRMVEALEWSGKEGFGAEELRDWKTSGELSGQTKAFGGLTWSTIYGAGHMVSLARRGGWAMADESGLGRFLLINLPNRWRWSSDGLRRRSFDVTRNERASERDREPWFKASPDLSFRRAVHLDR